MENFMIVLDTETTPMDTSLETVQASNMLVYDIGWIIVDRFGKVYDSSSFVVADVFLNKEFMKNAFYVEKIPQYWKEIKGGSRILMSFANIRKMLVKDCEQYGIKEVYCHNAYFDYTSLNRTQRYLTKSKYRYFFPFGITTCDTMKMAKLTFGKMEEYSNYCHDNGYITKNNRIRFTAEILYRFISNNADFSEIHMGLEDCIIEKEIMRACLEINNEVERKLFKEREVIFQTKFI